jgi:hypothetical protein
MNEVFLHQVGFASNLFEQIFTVESAVDLGSDLRWG